MMATHQRYRRYLETLTPESLCQLEEYVAGNVRFCDPFNDTIGVDAMRRVFQHMFAAVGPVSFCVFNVMSDGDTCLMSWRFEANLRGKPWSFDGASVISFDPDGFVVAHIDHWDAASAFYEKLPVIGALLRRLRGWLAAH